MVRKIIALLKKDFLHETSYKLAFIFNIFTVVTTLLIYFFIDKLFGHTMTNHLEKFGVNYFSYVLVSMAVFSYIGVGIGSFSARIRTEQLQGTLESLLLTPTRMFTILLGMCVWNFIIATADLIIYILLGIFFFHIRFADLNIVSTLTILVLTVISFSSLGIISASFILVLKKGDPIGWIINTFEGLLGGVYFPITVMPLFLQWIAKCLPITHAIRGMELAVYKGYSLSQLTTEWGILLLLSVVFLPLSIASFTYALKKVRKQGGLSHY
ncbi:MAG: ABC transporter permease [Candidatus Omnitrophica bacterium]|nr:ABC transporter permease [Candidatus Omnitrophota bacterium]